MTLYLNSYEPNKMQIKFWLHLKKCHKNICNSNLKYCLFQTIALIGRKPFLLAAENFNVKVKLIQFGLNII